VTDPVAEPALTVRLAGAADLGRLAALRREYGAEEHGPADDPGFEARFAGWLAGAGQRRLFWLAEVGAAPVGMLNLSVFERMPWPGRPDSRWGYIGNVFVLTGHRDRGVGRRLLDAALDYARRSDFARVVLAPSPRSVPFYSRAGFRPATSLLILEPVDDASGSDA
jgi:GNAT superfamily N-acetyltransferase